MINMNENVRKASFGQRVGAFLIDHTVLMVLLTVGFLLNPLNVFQQGMIGFFEAFPFVMLFGFVYYSVKDVFGGASIGKRMLGLAVRYYDADAGSQPPPLKLILRNLLTFAWPLEVISVLGSRDQRKLGDKAAGTDVYANSRQIKPAMNVIIVIVLLATFTCSLLFGVTSLMKNDESYATAIAYIEVSEEIKDIVGNINGYGFFVQGGISYSGGFGHADFAIRVIGDRQTIVVRVVLERIPGASWEITEVFHRPG